MSEEFDFATGMPSDEMAQYLQMFVDETSEQLDDLVEVLLVLEGQPNSTENLNESFRLIHSIKGAAAMMGLDSITMLTHHLENHFERLRSGLWTLDQNMMDLVLKCVDFLREATVKLRDGKPLASAPDLIEQLSRAEEAESPIREIEELSSSHRPLETQIATSYGDSTPGPPTAPGGESELERQTQHKRVIAYLDRGIELPELKAELILTRLRAVGQIERSIPEPDQLASVAQLRTLHVWLLTDQVDDALRAAADVVGVEMIEIDCLESDATTAIASESTPSEILVADSGGTKASVESGETTTKVAETVRVDLERLDRLMNLAGELIVNRARFVQLASQMKETFQKSGLQSRLRDLCDSLKEHFSTEARTCLDQEENAEREDKNRELQASIAALEEQLIVFEQGRRSYLQLHEAIDQYSRVSDGLQRGVLDTRMIPIGPLFNRFKRTIRDISVELNKKVNLVIRGENTELDKRMIDELGDPLIHLVRNAIDHGLESEKVRLSRGKAEIGTLSLEAEHRGNNVVITVSDDGGGISSDKVKRRAIERGLVSAIDAESMSDFELQQFIWSPGFSTAEAVSDISGRGVGMDIVRTRIRELSGTVEVHSTPGQGTKFLVRLPLTLAIIRSLLFDLEQGTFAAPIEHVGEIVSIHHRDIITVHHRNSIEVRGEFIPLVAIHDIFRWNDQQSSQQPALEVRSESGAGTSSVLILTTGSKSIGLVVSALRGCQDIVVKSLDENFTYIRGLSGASILGDGSVCLLLDVASCIEMSRQPPREKRSGSTVHA